MNYQTQRSIRPEQTQRRLEMLKLRLQGMLYKDIAAQYGVSVERVRQLIHLPLWISKAIEEEGITDISQLDEHFHPDLSMERRMAGYQIARRALGLDDTESRSVGS